MGREIFMQRVRRDLQRARAARVVRKVAPLRSFLAGENAPDAGGPSPIFPKGSASTAITAAGLCP